MTKPYKANKLHHNLINKEEYDKTKTLEGMDIKQIVDAINNGDIISNVIIKDREFDKTNWTNGKFKGVKFINCKFNQCDFFRMGFENCEFTRGSIRNSNFYEARLKNTKLPFMWATTTRNSYIIGCKFDGFSRCEFYDTYKFSNCVFTKNLYRNCFDHHTFDNFVFDDARMEGNKYNGVVFNKNKFKNTSLVNSLFRFCDFTNSIFSNSVMVDSVMNSCHINDIELEKTAFAHNSFYHGKMGNLSKEFDKPGNILIEENVDPVLDSDRTPIRKKPEAPTNDLSMGM